MVNLVSAGIPHAGQFAIHAVFLGLRRQLLGKRLTVVPGAPTPAPSEAMPVVGSLLRALLSW